jgi:hypothetical protein
MSPDVLKRLLIWREQPSGAILQMNETTDLLCAEQMEKVFHLE